MNGPTAPEADHPTEVPVGKARAYRTARTQVYERRRGWAVAGVAFVVLSLATYTLATVGPSTPGYAPPGPGTSIVVQFGPPTTSTVPCGSGGSAYVESIPWVNASGPVWTGEVSVVVYEIADGDFLGDPTVKANVTPTDPCAGSPPSAEGLWYAVLLAPNASTVLTFTDDAHWSAVTAGPTNVQVPDGSTLLLVTERSVAGSGRGLEITGVSGAVPVRGSLTL